MLGSNVGYEINNFSQPIKIIFSLTLSLPSFWSYFSTISFVAIGYQPTKGFIFQCHTFLPFHTLQTWTSPEGQYRNQIDYIFAAKDGEALYSQQKQDQELTAAKIMNSLLSSST